MIQEICLIPYSPTTNLLVTVWLKCGSKLNFVQTFLSNDPFLMYSTLAATTENKVEDMYIVVLVLTLLLQILLLIGVRLHNGIIFVC